MSSRSASIRAELLGAAVVLLEGVLFVTGLLALGSVYVTATQAGYTQMSGRTALYRVAVSAVLTPRTERIAAAPAVLVHPSPPLPESFVGELSIRRLGLSTTVLEGDSPAHLKVAVAHLSETPLPWQAGNSVYAGHRDTFFRALRGLRAGDDIELATPRGTFGYRVRHTMIVAPEDVWVLEPGLASLTLITCYPFSYLGSAPQRFVVQADRVDASTSAQDR